MGLFQGLTDLYEKSDSSLPRQSSRWIAFEAGKLAQRPPFDEIHNHEEETFFSLIEVEGIDGVGVCQASDDPRFVEEARHHGGVAAKLRPQHLDCHLLTKNQMSGLVDRPEAALSEGLVQPILLPQHLAREVVEDRHLNENAAVIGAALLALAIDRMTMWAHMLGHRQSLLSVS